MRPAILNASAFEDWKARLTEQFENNKKRIWEATDIYDWQLSQLSDNSHCY